MFTGFNLKADLSKSEYIREAKEFLSTYEDRVRGTLTKIAIGNEVIDGTKMQEDWFGYFNADIFISHSHGDRDSAICLSYLLKTCFGLTSFIDSVVWGHADDLLKQIDNEHCYDKERKVYDYSLRNSTTGHVHMMLATALNMMIDKTECLIFLNTPNSITPEGVLNKTTSPWIYHELAISKSIRKNIPKRYLNLITEQRSFSKALTQEDQIKVKYTADIEHLTELSSNDLMTWVKNYNGKQNALDGLYRMKNILTSSHFIK